ncbi:MAG: YeaC family protein [Permianibacter sp.]
MTVDQLIASMTPEIREKLTRAVELGKWPDGVRLSDAQRETIIEALMLWQARYQPDRAEAYTIDENGEMRFLCDSEKERLEAAQATFKITLQ